MQRLSKRVAAQARSIRTSVGNNASQRLTFFLSMCPFVHLSVCHSRRAAWFPRTFWRESYQLISLSPAEVGGSYGSSFPLFPPPCRQGAPLHFTPLRLLRFPGSVWHHGGGSADNCDWLLVSPSAGPFVSEFLAFSV